MKPYDTKLNFKYMGGEITSLKKYSWSNGF